MAIKLLRGYVFIMALTLTMTLPSSAYQGGERQAAHQTFTFRPGQSLYIAAIRRVDEHRHGTTNQAPGFGHDLDSEKRVRKEIEGLRVFKVVDKISDADFVLLVHIDTSTAEAIALAPEDYRRNREKFDLDAMRESAYGRSLVRPFKLPTLGRMCSRLAEQFHEDSGVAGKGKK